MSMINKSSNGTEAHEMTVDTIIIYQYVQYVRASTHSFKYQ